MELNKTQFSNIPHFIEGKLGKQLHNQTNHPIEIMKRHIYAYFSNLDKYKFTIFDNLNPIVTIVDNFDKLLIPKDHPARSRSDTYYVNENEVLRTHTSAHQNDLLNKGYETFIVTGDVYRKDEIDASHYPIFHQVEVLTVVNDEDDPEIELKALLSGLVEYLFPKCNYRFNNDYFPFTNPSFEVEVEFNNSWMEILGCGVVQPAILSNNGISKKAIAAGFGLDRLTMIFAGIIDIRYLWATNSRFLDQYKDGRLNKFQPYSELPSQKRDISFYIPSDKLDIDKKWLYENDFFELIRNHAGDSVESVKLVDSFHNTKKNRFSKTYTIMYSPTDPDMSNPAVFKKVVNELQDKLRELVLILEIELR